VRFTRGIEEFFDTITKPGDTPQAGRAWKPKELRLKNFDDLHKLWFVLLKERNKLLTEKAQLDPGRVFPHFARFSKVKDSMRAIKVVLGERMRLKSTEVALQTAQEAESPDRKEVARLQKLLTELRTLSGTPELPLPDEEVPVEEKREEVERPPQRQAARDLMQKRNERDVVRRKWHAERRQVEAELEKTRKTEILRAEKERLADIAEKEGLPQPNEPLPSVLLAKYHELVHKDHEDRFKVYQEWQKKPRFVRVKKVDTSIPRWRRGATSTPGETKRSDEASV